MSDNLEAREAQQLLGSIKSIPQQILKLKKKLSDTDYVCNKIIKRISTKEDYAEFKD